MIEPAIDLLVAAAGEMEIPVAGEERCVAAAIQALAGASAAGFDLSVLRGLQLLAMDFGVVERVAWPHVAAGSNLCDLAMPQLAMCLRRVGETRTLDPLPIIRAEELPVLAVVAQHLAAASIALGNRPGCRAFLRTARGLEELAAIVGTPIAKSKRRPAVAST